MFQSYRKTEKEDALINRETSANVNFREIKNTKTDNPPFHLIRYIHKILFNDFSLS